MERHQMCSSSTLVLVQLRKTHPEVNWKIVDWDVKYQIKNLLGITQEVNIPDCEDSMFSSVNVY